MLVAGRSAVTLYEECMKALRESGARVIDGYLILTVHVGKRRFPFDRWRFNLFVKSVHDRTPHECAVTVG